jgi:hypothetical protein
LKSRQNLITADRKLSRGGHLGLRRDLSLKPYKGAIHLRLREARFYSSFEPLL